MRRRKKEDLYAPKIYFYQVILALWLLIGIFILILDTIGRDGRKLTPAILWGVAFYLGVFVGLLYRIYFLVQKADQAKRD